MRKIYKFLFSTCIALLLNGFVSPGLSHAATPMVAASATNGQHTCALTASGGIECWGRNNSGQLGNGATTNSNRAVVVSGFTSGASTVTTGEDHSCALNNSGVVSCWGGNTYGQLGNGTNTSRSSPVNVSLSGTAIAVAATGYTTCALTSTGAVQCWGLNGAGQLGNGTTTNRNTPVFVTGLTSGVVAIAGGGSGYICALTSSGAVKCWGDNTSGSLGNGSTTYAYTPTSVSGLSSGVVAITAGSGHACALTSAGAVRCWGSNSYGQLGILSTNNSLVPVSVSGVSSGISAISAGGFHTCAVTTAGTVKCWGYNADGQLGTGSIPTASPWGITSPTTVTGLSSTASTISAGFKHTCAVTSQGKVECWGSNQSGQLGNGSTVASSTPVQVLDESGILDLRTYQNITFLGQPTLNVGTISVVRAVASSGLPVIFGTSTPAVCSINGNLIQALAKGTCSVTGNQNGDTSYRAAPQVNQNITVNQLTVPEETATVPAAPTAVSATLGNASAIVSFTPPTNNGRATITSYTVTASPGGLTATGRHLLS
jgi:alpha-tubulin suppressor-like RCC1 family protein